MVTFGFGFIVVEADCRKSLQNAVFYMLYIHNCQLLWMAIFFGSQFVALERPDGGTVLIITNRYWWSQFLEEKKFFKIFNILFYCAMISVLNIISCRKL